MLSFSKEGRSKTIAKQKEPFDQNRYIQSFMKENYKKITLLLNKKSDSDIIEHLEEQKNMNGYIKALIRKDMDTE